MKLAWLAGALFGLGVGVWLPAIVPAHAQEKPERETRQWHVAMLPGVDGNSYAPVRVDVVDTEGVCLYITRGWSHGDGGASIAAVPKSQLPKGAGCQ